ncbi:UMP kinase [Candidatus Woesearchaeota archaeon]|nr:UMP kinase [Candidatus Woesearchaeota archaeon]
MVDDVKKTVVISVGGSLVVPEEIDTGFLRAFRDFALGYVGSYCNRLVLVCGGGRTCRSYNEAAKAVCDVANDDLDWLGIMATRLNAELLRCIMNGQAYDKVVRDPGEPIKTDRDIIISGGYTPGNSSDKVAVMLAKRFDSDSVINMTNVDMLYDKDPKRSRDARPIRKIKWDRFLEMFGHDWVPGTNVPFDPVASRLAKESGIRVIILNGKDMPNLKRCVDGKDFTGTVIY